MLAHVSNNLMNDLFDVEVGNDTASYPRALYAPHPVLSGMVSRQGLAGAALAVNVGRPRHPRGADLLRGWPVVAFALAGFLLSVAYTAPPLRLKKRGLGEPDVFVVWGPLMVCGTYYAAVGHLPWEVGGGLGPLWPSVYGGAHGQAHRQGALSTRPSGCGPCPSCSARAGPGRSPGRPHDGRLLRAVVRVRGGGRPALAGAVVLGGAAQARPGVEAFGEPKPDEPPGGSPVWPLWFAAVAFIHTRRAGSLLVLGLAVAAIANIR